MDFEGLKKYVLDLLDRGLPEDLSYHNVSHTRDRVLPAVERLCDMEGIVGDDKVIIMSAAVLHDIGYLKRYEDNEVLAVEMSREILTDFGYESVQIDKICELIMATKMPQYPKDLFAEILCDADLSNLGDENFVDKSDKLRLEFGKHGMVYSDSEWNKIQIEFLKKHSYFTKSARELFDKQKSKNLDFYVNKIKV